MKRLVTLMICAVSLGSAAQQLPGFNLVFETDSTGIFVSTDKVIWADAQGVASAFGGHLVTISDEQENAGISSVLSAVPGQGYWIGLEQEASAADPTDDWGWVTGEPLTYTNWSNFEPGDNGGEEVGLENCAEVSHIGGWNDAPCQGDRYFLIELTLPIVEGCTNSAACNFSQEAVVDDGSCLYLDACGECGGDGISGCTDADACNFNIEAECDDGSCDYTCCPGPGCCTEGMYWDWELSGCYNINPADINLDGCVQLNDLLDLLSAYGDCGAEESPWQCGEPLEYQGYDYEPVQIGDQCWFAENLRAENYRNGDSILANLNDDQWSNTTLGAVAVYGEDPGCFDGYPGSFNACDAEQSLNEYGRMYNFYAVDDPRGLCPSGWHVPMDEEWTSMIGFLGGGGVAGYHMKATNGWYNLGSGSDSSGFSGLPGGYRDHNDGNFNNSGDNGFWWNSTTQAGSHQKAVNLISGSDSANEVSRLPRQGLSVRCIQDTD